MWNRLACLALAAGCLVVARPALPRHRHPTSPDTSWVARSALYEVFVQDFSPAGNFKGVRTGWIAFRRPGRTSCGMPIHPIGVLNRKGSLGSPYAARDYRAINPAYGTAADFRALVKAVHARGMKLILDWVPDHTAPDHAWVKQHPDYYMRNERGEPQVPREPTAS